MNRAFFEPFRLEFTQRNPSNNDVQFSSIAVWSNLYNRFDNGILPREYFLNSAMNLKERSQVFRELSQRMVNSPLFTQYF